jgi:decaprenyl-phosphate phosphoribosyltransferase
MSISVTQPLQANLRDYISLARPGYWFKNIFMIPGMVMAFMFSETVFSAEIFLKLLIAVASTCLVASANYVINEWLDAEFDKHHPTKKNRSSVVKKLSRVVVYGEYLMLAGCGLSLALILSLNFFWVALWLLVMGFLYNVRPFRTKERVYLDVISESINNPIRFLLGWLVIQPVLFPPISILIAYWMGGAFLMACKRLAEYRFINDKTMAALYRRSFAYYTETSLLISVFFYALTSTFFLAIFLVKHRIELLLTFPLFALLFSWYLAITFRPNSTAQNPEKLYQNWKFMIFIVLFFAFFLSLLFIDVPWLDYFLEHNFGKYY